MCFNKSTLNSIDLRTQSERGSKHPEHRGRDLGAVLGGLLSVQRSNRLIIVHVSVSEVDQISVSFTRVL